MTTTSTLLLLSAALSAIAWPADLILADSTEPKRPTPFLPAYPPQMQADGREAKLVAVYVVDTSGKADLGTVRFLLDAPLDA